MNHHPFARIDLKDERNRDWFINCLLKSYCCDKSPTMMPHVECRDKKNKVKMVEETFAQFVVMEFLNHRRRKQFMDTLFSLIRDRRKGSQRGDFVEPLMANQLALRYIFDSNEWGLSTTLILLALDLARQRTEYIEILGRPIQCLLPYDLVPLIASMEFWKWNHVQFAMNNGLGALIMGLTQRSRKSLMDARIHNVVVGSFLKCLGKHNMTRQVDPRLIQHAGCGLHKQRFATLKLRKKGYGERCGWPLCTKRKDVDSFAARSICKGCRLIRYCCRSHQKRHWKYMHRQQCLHVRL